MKRQDVESTIAEIIESILRGNNELELADVEYVKEGQDFVLRVFIDKEDGVTLDDCEWVSRRLSAQLDESDPIPGSYNLEVSSPGLERPLKKDSDYKRFAGRLVNVSTYSPIEGKKEWQGHLVGLQNNEIVIDLGDGELNIPRDQIAKARLAIEF